MNRATGPLVLSLVLLFAPAARAQPRQECLDTFVTAQVHQKKNELGAARAALLVCSKVECPEPLQSTCVGWLADVDKRMPSIVISARGPDGRDRADVRVLIDGAPLTDQLDGRALTIEPGPHRLRYELPGSPAIEDDIVVNEGEKYRKVAVAFNAPMLAVRPRPTDSPSVPPPRSSALPWLFTGVGAAAMGSWGYFGYSGVQQRRELDAAACKPACPGDKVDAVRQRFLVADISLGVGIVALGIATYLWTR